MKKASDLAHEEKERFIYHFFDKIDTALPEDLSFDDITTIHDIWSSPWLFHPDIHLIGDTIEEMATNYIESVKYEIITLLREEE